MLIEPRVKNAITIITALGETYEIHDTGEMGLCIVRTDHKEIEIRFADKNKPTGKGFMIYLK